MQFHSIHALISVCNQPVKVIIMGHKAWCSDSLRWYHVNVHAPILTTFLVFSLCLERPSYNVVNDELMDAAGISDVRELDSDWLEVMYPLVNAVCRSCANWLSPRVSLCFCDDLFVFDIFHSFWWQSSVIESWVCVLFIGAQFSTLL